MEYKESLYDSGDEKSLYDPGIDAFPGLMVAGPVMACEAGGLTGHCPVGGSTVPGYPDAIQCNDTVNQAVLAPWPKPLLDTPALALRNWQCSAPWPRTTPG
eukprot:3470345-Rhodomonas_salina.2